MESAQISGVPKPPLPPFDAQTAAQKVRLAEDAWNNRDPQKVSLAYTPDSVWRNRAEFLSGRENIVQFLARKCGNENWEFDELGYMKRRIASINDLPIQETERKFHWPQGRRPDNHPGLSELGL